MEKQIPHNIFLMFNQCSTIHFPSLRKHGFCDRFIAPSNTPWSKTHPSLVQWHHNPSSYRLCFPFRFSFRSQTSGRNDVIPFRSEFIPCFSVTSHSGIPVGVSALFARLGFRKLRTNSRIRSSSAVIPGKIW